jgi:hypothetical protein
MARLSLPTVTICAAASVNVAATVRALEICLDQIDFADCLLFGAGSYRGSDPRIRVMDGVSLNSGADYSNFVLHGLGTHVTTPHALIVQWDGFVLDPARWDPRFLDYDYIGAPWPQFGDGHDVGNGGFSLRSRKLMEACQHPQFVSGHPEDVAICRTNRTLLELQGIRFADRALAEIFSIERGNPAGPTFGFHGIFNMIAALGADRFWEAYKTLDDRRTAAVDFGLLFRQLGSGANATRRRLRLTIDYLATAAGW